MRRLIVCLILLGGVLPVFGQETQAILQHERLTTYPFVSHVGWGYEGAWIASYSHILETESAGMLEVWDSASGEKRAEKQLFLQDLAVHPTQAIVYYTTQAGEFVAWRVEENTELRVQAHDTPALLAIDAKGQSGVTIDLNGVILWDLDTFSPRYILPVGDDVPNAIPAKPSFSATGEWVAWFDYPQSIRVVAGQNASEVTRITLNSIAQASTARLLQEALISLNEGSLDVQSLSTAELIGRYSGAYPITLYELSQDGGQLVTAHEDGAIVLWETLAQRLVYTVATPKISTHALAFHPSGRALVFGTSDGKIAWYDINPR